MVTLFPQNAVLMAVSYDETSSRSSLVLGKFPWSVLGLVVTLYPTTCILWFRVYSLYDLSIFRLLHFLFSEVRREQDHVRSEKAR